MIRQGKFASFYFVIFVNNYFSFSVYHMYDDVRAVTLSDPLDKPVAGVFPCPARYDMCLHFIAFRVRRCFHCFITNF